MTAVRTRAPGRPRDSRVDALVLETALAMLAEVGPPPTMKKHQSAGMTESA